MFSGHSIPWGWTISALALCLFIGVTLPVSATSALTHCAGEFSLCPDGSCALVSSSCGVCQPSQYACPLDVTCLDSISDYATACKIAGTYLDVSLGEDARLDRLVDAVASNMPEVTQQLINNAPAIPSVALPAYNYLNDD